MPALGGTPVPIVATSDRPGGGTWRADGTIVFATSEGLYQVSENGGEPRLLVKPDPSAEGTRLRVAAVHARRTVGVVHDRSRTNRSKGRRSPCWM